jgi:AAA ATPase domain
MLRFGIKNLRRLVSVDLIEIKPITILVGRNSSGKSSFLRALPLIRQTLMKRTSSPILWYGDFVDFGSFEGAVTGNNIDKSISFLFGIDRMTVQLRGPYGYAARIGKQLDNIRLETRISALVEPNTSSSDNVKTYISALSISFDGGTYAIELDGAGDLTKLTVDGQDVRSLFVDHEMYLSSDAVFPELEILPKDRAGELAYAERHYVAKAVGRIIKPYLNKLVKDAALQEYSATILSLRTFDRKHIWRIAQHANSQSFKRLLIDLSEGNKTEIYEKLRLCYLANWLPETVQRLSRTLREMILSTLYIGPARARSERYYRYQDLSVSEIDPNGENFAMFLNSLAYSEQESLSSWIERLFNYRIDIVQSPGHLSINLVEGARSTNIVDTGYGVSQILPVLGQIWWAKNKSRRTRARRNVPSNSMIAIEQPELHLHPAHQALLADALVDQVPAKEDEEQVNFLVETHSETLVNRLGELISEGKLLPENVQVLIFQPSKDNVEQTNVSIARFGEKGELINWPFGFFLPAE